MSRIISSKKISQQSSKLNLFITKSKSKADQQKRASKATHLREGPTPPTQPRDSADSPPLAEVTSAPKPKPKLRDLYRSGSKQHSGFKGFHQKNNTLDLEDNRRFSFKMEIKEIQKSVYLD